MLQKKFKNLVQDLTLHKIYGFHQKSTLPRPCLLIRSGQTLESYRYKKGILYFKVFQKICIEYIGSIRRLYKHYSRLLGRHGWLQKASGSWLLQKAEIIFVTPLEGRYNTYFRLLGRAGWLQKTSGPWLLKKAEIICVTPI